MLFVLSDKKKKQNKKKLLKSSIARKKDLLMEQFRNPTSFPVYEVVPSQRTREIRLNKSGQQHCQVATQFVPQIHEKNSLGVQM